LLALWGIKSAQSVKSWGSDLELDAEDIGGGAVICPALDSWRSLNYLVNDPLGKYLEKAITRKLKSLLWQMHLNHPQAFDLEAIRRVSSIQSFDHEMVLPRLGLSSVEEYYAITSGLSLLAELRKPTLIIYAADDPMFAPTLVTDLQTACANNPAIDLTMTRQGGHVGYVSSAACQCQVKDADRWWAWNRVLDWCDHSRHK
jgi:uncharacterized protein